MAKIEMQTKKDFGKMCYTVALLNNKEEICESFWSTMITDHSNLPNC